MARKRNEYGKGKTVKEIFSGISRNLSRVKDETLRAAVTRLSSAMNKRITRAEKTGDISPAVRDAMNSGGRFSAKGKDRPGLMNEFIRLKNFFTNPTSTKAGWEKVQKDAAKHAGLAPHPSAPAPAPDTPPEPMPGPAPSPVPETPEAPATPGPSVPSEPAPEEYVLGMPPWVAGAPVGWMPPEGWTYDEEDGTWRHPDYGSGWIPYEGTGGGMFDPITEEIVGNQDRQGHDWDTRIDPKRWENGNESGKIWEMVDSLVKTDARFARQYHYSDVNSDPRNMLFNAIDDAWTSHTDWSFEDARDYVATKMQDIYEASSRYEGEAKEKGDILNAYRPEDASAFPPN